MAIPALPALLALCLALGAQPDSAPAQQRTHAVIGAGSKCLVPDADRAGAEVRLGACSAEGAAYHLVGGSIRTTDGHCVAWINEGGPVHLAECRRGRKGQLWRLDGSGRLRSAHREDICMDVEGGDTADGTRVLAWRCQGGDAPAPNQKFQLSGSPRG